MVHQDWWNLWKAGAKVREKGMSSCNFVQDYAIQKTLKVTSDKMKSGPLVEWEWNLCDDILLFFDRHKGEGDWTFEPTRVYYQAHVVSGSWGRKESRETDQQRPLKESESSNRGEIVSRENVNPVSDSSIVQNCDPPPNDVQQLWASSITALLVAKKKRATKYLLGTIWTRWWVWAGTTIRMRLFYLAQYFRASTPQISIQRSELNLISSQNIQTEVHHGKIIVSRAHHEIQTSWLSS